MNRRRFLSLSAAALIPLPGHAGTLTEWHGAGLGTALTLRLIGADPHQALSLIHISEPTRPY